MWSAITRSDVRQIGRAGDFRHAGDQIAEQVDVIVGVNVLQHRGNTLQTHTGVDGRLRQRLHGTVSLTVELHEDDVPNLNVTVAIFFPGFPEGRPRCDRRGQKISVHGPHGPVSPICQKLSEANGAPLLSPMRIIRSRGTPTSLAQMSASSSVS